MADTWKKNNGGGEDGPAAGEVSSHPIRRILCVITKRMNFTLQATVS